MKLNGIDVGYHHHLEAKIDGIDMDWLSMGYPAIHGLSYTYTNNVQYEHIWGTLAKYTKIREFETIPMFTYVDVKIDGLKILESDGNILAASDWVSLTGEGGSVDRGATVER